MLRPQGPVRVTRPGPSLSKFSAYNSLAPDCQGGWVMYWMQSMPGYNNAAKDNAGQPMLPWWPFAFY
jgi:hypothetical protein